MDHQQGGLTPKTTASPAHSQGASVIEFPSQTRTAGVDNKTKGQMPAAVRKTRAQRAASSSIWVAAELFRDIQALCFKTPTHHRYLDNLVVAGFRELASRLGASEADHAGLEDCASAIEACRWLPEMARQHVARSLRRLIAEPGAMAIALAAIEAAARTYSPNRIAEALEDVSATIADTAGARR